MQAIREQLARLDLKQQPRELFEVYGEYRKEKKQKADSVYYVMVSYSQRKELYEDFKAISHKGKGSMWLLPLINGMGQRILPDMDIAIYRWEVPDERL